MEREALLDRYKRLGEAIDRATARIRERHPREVQCCPGCNLCCHDFFQVSILEAAAVRRAVENLPLEDRRRIAENLRRLSRELESRGLAIPGGHHPAGDPDSLGKTFRARGELEGERGLCPANLDGRCAVYADRPAICRTFGFLVDGFFFGCPGGNFEDEDARYASLVGGPIDRELAELSEAFVAGTPLASRQTDNRYMAAVDWERCLERGAPRES